MTGLAVINEGLSRKELRAVRVNRLERSAHEFVVCCEVEGCKAQSMVFSTIGLALPDSRARVLFTLNGWQRIGMGKWVCSEHHQQEAR